MKVIDSTNKDLGYSSNPYNNVTPRRQRPKTMTATPVSKSALSMRSEDKSWERHCTNSREDFRKMKKPADFLKPARHQCCCHGRSRHGSRLDVVSEYSRNVQLNRSASNCSINSKRQIAVSHAGSATQRQKLTTVTTTTITS